MQALDLLFARGRLRGARFAIIAFSLALSVVGVAFVHSTTAGEFDTFPSESATSQLVKLGVGLVLVVAILSIDYRVLERLAYVLYVVLLLLLGALLVVKRSGDEDLLRSFQIGKLSVQPSELMKVVVVLALARFLRYRTDQVRLTGLIRPFLLTIVPMLFVVLQPDLGTSLMLPPVLLVLLFIANAKRSHLGVSVVAGVLLVPAVFLVHLYFPGVSRKILHEYQMQRIEGYFDRSEESWANVNYQLRQSLIAFGSGGLTGKGYKRGTQNRHDYLPARHTDFIFAVVGEELGFVGSTAVILLYMGLVLAMVRVAVLVNEPFPRLVAAGIATLFAAQGLENFGMTLGLTPITGIPLPFVSFGGSSLVTSYVAIGVVLGIAIRPRRTVASQALNPQAQRRTLAVIDDHPSGANHFPNSPW